MRDCDIYVIARNALEVRDIVMQLFPLKENAILIMAAPPVDVLTNVVQEWCLPFLPRHQVIGVGTCQDTLRVQSALAEVLGMSPKDVHAYVVGQRGEAQVFVRSAASVAGLNISLFPDVTGDILDNIEHGKHREGVGECVASLCEAIVMDTREVMCVSTFHDTYDACVGWPSVVGAHGISKVLPLKLETFEALRMKKSAKHIKRIVGDTLHALCVD